MAKIIVLSIFDGIGCIVCVLYAGFTLPGLVGCALVILACSMVAKISKAFEI